MSLGEKLQQLRKQEGMSQEELAEQLNVSRQAVSKWELGESLPDTKNIIQLGKMFGVSMDYLLNDDIENINSIVAKNETSEQKEAAEQPKISKMKISITTLTGCILTFLGVCSVLIFWVVSIANPAEYRIVTPIPIGSSPTLNGTDKIYDGLQGFLMSNKAGGLFIFCCCVIFAGLGIIIFDKIIKQPKKSGMKISRTMLIGWILSFLGAFSLFLFWIISFINPSIEYYNNTIYEGLKAFLLYPYYKARLILFVFCCCITVAGFIIILFDIIKKKKLSSNNE